MNSIDHVRPVPLCVLSLVLGMEGTATSQAKAPPWFGAALTQAATQVPFAFVLVVPPPGLGPDGKPAPRSGYRVKANRRLMAHIRALRKETLDPGTARRIDVIEGYTCYDTQEELALHLELLGLTTDADTQEAWLTAPFVCARAEWVGAAAGETLMLVDGKGKRLAGRAVDFSARAQFAAAVRGMAREKDRLDRAADGTDPALLQALGNLVEGDHAARARTLKEIQSVFAQNRAAVLLARDHAGRPGADAETKAAFDALVRTLFRARQAPAGSSVEYKASLHEPAADPCPACGLGRMPANARMMISFLVK